MEVGVAQQDHVSVRERHRPDLPARHHRDVAHDSDHHCHRKRTKHKEHDGEGHKRERLGTRAGTLDRHERTADLLISVRESLNTIDELGFEHGRILP